MVILALKIEKKVKELYLNDSWRFTIQNILRLPP